MTGDKTAYPVTDLTVTAMTVNDADIQGIAKS
jgi:hypothetical protein